MALINAEFFMAQSLCRGTSIRVILPEPGCGRPNSIGRYPVLWLLHDEGGNCSSWTRYTSLERYVEQAGIACIMPTIDFSFGANIDSGRFFDWISEELRTYCAAMYPISDKGQDNFIAGVGMGGYAALKIGLTLPTHYGKIATFSASHLTENDLAPIPGGPRHPHNLWRNLVFKTTSVTELTDGEFDLLHLASETAHASTTLPIIHTFCTREDYRLDAMQTDAEYFRQLGFTYTLTIGEGETNWTYLDCTLPLMFTQLNSEKL